MTREARNYPHLHGNGDVGVSRYFALYLAQAAGWRSASICWSTPTGPRPASRTPLLEVYSCSMRLAEQRGWIELALMTWLWSTPILVALEVLRHYGRYQQRRR